MNKKIAHTSIFCVHGEQKYRLALKRSDIEAALGCSERRVLYISNLLAAPVRRAMELIYL